MELFRHEADGRDLLAGGAGDAGVDDDVFRVQLAGDGGDTGDLLRPLSKSFCKDAVVLRGILPTCQHSPAVPRGGIMGSHENLSTQRTGRRTVEYVFFR